MNDLISRDAAIKAHCDLCKVYADNKCDRNHRRACLDVDVFNLIPSTEPKIVRCKDCSHFHYDYWSDALGVPLIVGHEICDFWGNGCMTKEDAFCSYAERREKVYVSAD